VVLAGQVGIIDHVSIGEGAQCAARAAIMSDVPDGAVVMGAPARPRGEQLRIEAATRRLPDLVRRVRELAKRLSDLEGRLEKDSP
jgi:UDP-3-O-[3-hydroxymyristoyl] glucosamine N-acyltransferase